MTKKPPDKDAPDKPDFRPIAFAIDGYLKSRRNKRKVNRGNIGSNNPKPEESPEPKEQE
ncbi:TPA: hypothetical protein N2G35_000944 [Salmonella enterica]|nr:hypothetical protein [Salmonella enterica]